MVAMALGTLAVACRGTSFVAFESGVFFLGVGVSALTSGALRYLATLHGDANEADANQAAVSLLTNVGLLVGGSLWGAAIASSSHVTVATVRLGLLVLTAALVLLSLGVLVIPGTRRSQLI
jgi:uncharacterized membrane protein YidH (DUF202 family)